MARRFFTGNTIGLYVNEGTPAAPSWMLVACSQTDGFSSNTNNIEVASKCEGGFTSNMPGNIGWEFTSSAYALLGDDIGTNEVSRLAVAQLHKSKEIKEWRLSNEDESYYVRGEGYISAFSDSPAVDEVVTFDITITGTGEYFLEPEPVA